MKKLVLIAVLALPFLAGCPGFNSVTNSKHEGKVFKEGELVVNVQESGDGTYKTITICSPEEYALDTCLDFTDSEGNKCYIINYCRHYE